MARNTAIVECNPCRPHEFQDSKYGKNKRVYNLSGNKEKKEGSCTVCGKKGHAVAK